MNRGSLLTLVAALSIAGILCAAVPQLVGQQSAPLAVTTAGSTQSTAAHAAASVPTTASASRPQTAPATTPSTVEQFRERAEQTRGSMVYILLVAILVLSGLGLPIPEEIPLMFAGYRAWHGAASLYLLIPIGLIGVLTADMMLFLAARYWRSHIFRLRLIRATIRPRHLVLARTQFHNHGMKIVILARWLPALRTAVCLTAGLTGVSVWHFLLIDATAAAITVPTSILLGYFAANQIDKLVAVFQKAEHTALLIVLLAMAAVVIYWIFWGRHKHRQQNLSKPLPSLDSEEPPVAKTVEPSSHHGDTDHRNESI